MMLLGPPLATPLISSYGKIYAEWLIVHGLNFAMSLEILYTDLSHNVIEDYQPLL